MSDTANSTSTAVINKTCPVCGAHLNMTENGSIKQCSVCGYIETLGTYTPEEVGQILANSNKHLTAHKSTDDLGQPTHVGGMYGWICPKCGAVMSPFVDFCPNCTHHNWEITYSTTSTGPTHMYENKQSTFDANKFIGGRKDKLGYE